MDTLIEPRRRRRRFLLLGAPLALLVLAAVLFPTVLRAIVVREAKARGVDVTAGSMSLGFGTLELRDARFALIGVRGVSVAADRVTFERSGLTLNGASAEGWIFAIEGDTFPVDLAAWAGAYPDTLAIPIAAAEARVTFRETGDHPLVELDDAALAMSPGAGLLKGARVRAAGRALGTLDVSWLLDASSLTLGVGGEAPAVAPLSLVARTGPGEPKLTVTLAPTALGPLGAAIGVQLPHVTVNAHLEMALPHGDRRQALEGTMALGLRGYVPPHPKELDGIVFGDRQEVSAGVSIPEDRRQVVLRNLRLSAGAMKLSGAGSATPSGEGVRVRMKLAGTLPCGELASSAAVADLGKTLGPLAGDLAKRALTGSVAVAVEVDADTSDLSAARVDKSATVRCGLDTPF